MLIETADDALFCSIFTRRLENVRMTRCVRCAGKAVAGVLGSV
jgi:hypothetical protein